MKLNIGVRSLFYKVAFISLALGLQACGGGGGGSTPNSAPTASAVSITDDNGGTAVYKDTLTASYSYNDVDGDAEGSTTFIWLRNGTAISGATASTYTLTAPDTAQSITLSVTPVAAAGITTGSLDTSSGITVDALPDQDGSGIYNGTANIDSENTDILDLRGIIYNSRFLFFSETASTHVLYDGTITAITTYNYTATVNVYENGVKTQTDVAVTGNVLTAETMTGTMGTPGDAGNHNGTFSLTFNSKYNEGATTGRIESVGFGNTADGTTYGTLDLFGMHTIKTDFVFNVNSSGASTCFIQDVYAIPDAAVNIYTLNNIEIFDPGPICLDSYEGTGYSGFMSVVDDVNDGADTRILIAYTNGTNSVFGFLVKQSPP